MSTAPKTHRCAVRSSAILGVLLLALVPGRGWAADRFDHYTNPVLARVVESKNVRALKELTTNDILDHERVLAGVPGTFLVVRTNEGRYAKLLVRDARQKIGPERSVPVLLIERYVTFREGEERAEQAAGRNLTLFPNFRLSLDLGQVVPEEVGGDLQFVVEKQQVLVRPVGKARLYLVTKALPDMPGNKGGKLVVGSTFEPRYFNGTYKLYDDGRRSGTLQLQVEGDGAIKGAFYSDKDGRKYEVRGKIGMPAHAVQFIIKFPRAEEQFEGHLFTGDAHALAGTSRLAEREAGFYAVRSEE